MKLSQWMWQEYCWRNKVMLHTENCAEPSDLHLENAGKEKGISWKRNTEDKR